MERIFKMKHIDPDKFHFWIKQLFGPDNYSNFPDVEAGINQDDCAILKINDEYKVVITTDFLNANPIALELKVGNHYSLGRITVASNISDLCGTGARPIGFLLGISSSKDSPKEYMEDFVRGVYDELNKYKIPLIGGDTKLSKTDTFSGIAIGIADSSRKLFPKMSAKIGDLLWVSGNIGSLCASVHGLSNNFGDEGWKKWAKEKIINPILPIEKSEKVALLKIGNGGTDISDGLSADLVSLCSASNVGALIFTDRMPIDNNVITIAEFMKYPPWYYSLIMGGDFQFLISTDSKYKNQMESIGFVNIGELINPNGGIRINDGTKIYPMPTVGHEDARKKSFSEEIEHLLQILKIAEYEAK